MKPVLLVVLEHFVLNSCPEQVSMTYLEGTYNILDEIF